MKPNILDHISNFDTINLEQLNATASFLDRIEAKFVLNLSQLPAVIEDFKQHFYILEIAWTKLFSYDSVYMDTKDYKFYNQHQDKQKTRTKIRTRLYEDSNLAFFEFKQRSGKTTRKFRYEYGAQNHWKLNKEAKSFFNWVYQSMYGSTLKEPISPAIWTQYKRLTFVSKTTAERVTIDLNVVLRDLRQKKKKKHELENLVIIESKSMSTDCLSHRILAKHLIPQAACSKYCLWVYYMGHAENFSTFEKTINTAEKIKAWEKIIWIETPIINNAEEVKPLELNANVLTEPMRMMDEMAIVE